MPPESELLQSHLRVPEHVVYRTFDAETLLLNLKSGEYHGLNETGGRILELLGENGGDLSAAIAALATEYGITPDEVSGDVVAFCQALLDRGLVEVGSSSE